MFGLSSFQRSKWGIVCVIFSKIRKSYDVIGLNHANCLWCESKFVLILESSYVPIYFYHALSILFSERKFEKKNQNQYFWITFKY